MFAHKGFSCRCYLPLGFIVAAIFLVLDNSVALASCLDLRKTFRADVVAVGIHRATGKLVRHPMKDHMPDITRDLRTMHITGQPEGKPLVLVLTAYDETHWQLDEKIRDRVKAVVVYGYHVQSVSGFNNIRGMPSVSKRTGIHHGPSYCGLTVALPYRGGPALEKLFQYTRTMIGKPISKFIGRYEAGQVDIDEKIEPVVFPQGSIKVVSPSRPGPIRQVDLPKGGEAIKYLLELGHIRSATVEDFLIWTRRATERFESGHLAPVEMPQVVWSRAFVAQTKITFPSDLWVDAFPLIIPAGVPEPEPNGVITYYFEETGSCKGRCLVLE